MLSDVPAWTPPNMRFRSSPRVVSALEHFCKPGHQTPKKERPFSYTTIHGPQKYADVCFPGCGSQNGRHIACGINAMLGSTYRSECSQPNMIYDVKQHLSSPCFV